MPLLINLRQLEKKDQVLQGEIPAEELELSGIDECIETPLPLKYNLVAELMEGNILVQGQIELELRCACVRCLKVFTQRLDLRDWAVHLTREGAEAVKVVNDMIDLAPFLREDVLLEFPQHPLCEEGCKGLPGIKEGGIRQAGGDRREDGSSAWAELNKLKL
jgi:uncharacterized metal-binding protein YceD (DUF177 family)